MLLNRRSAVMLMAYALMPSWGMSAACQTSEYVLLSNVEPTQVQLFCSRPGLTGVFNAWKPSCAEIQSAENNLPGFLSGLTIKSPARDLRGGFRQYIAFERNAVQLLFINRTPKDDQISNRSLRVRDMCDGGESVWSVEYNVKTKVFSNFKVSGPSSYPDKSPSAFDHIE